MKSVPIISVTGTKGKTTTVSVIGDILHRLGHNIVRVDTKGHYVNGEQRSTLEESKSLWGLVPTKSPGRYLWDFYADDRLRSKGVAVLECAIGCSGTAGLGYDYHDIGIFLNVFEDHLGSSPRLNSRSDIAEAKSFIFKRIASDGYAIFNADDALVTEMMNRYADHIDSTRKIALGIDLSEIDTSEHLSAGGSIVTVNDSSEIVLRTTEGDLVLASLHAIPWTFDGKFKPSVYNLMAALAGVYAQYDGDLPSGFRGAVEGVRLDPYGGRLTLLQAKNGAKIIADYAHEKQSLAAVADLARSQIRPSSDGKVIGVVRMAYDRTDETFLETGAVIGEKYDQVIVYEKIDGYFRKAKNNPGKKFRQIEGRTSQVLYDGVKSTNDDVIRIPREDQALEYASSVVKPNDVVVVIVNDDIRRSIDFIKSSFEAELL